MVLTLSRQFVTLTGTGKAVRVFLCSVDILGTSIYHTALTKGIVPVTELNLT